MNQHEASDKLAKARRIALLLADMPELQTDADDVEHWTEAQLYGWLAECGYEWIAKEQRWHYWGTA